MIAPRELWKWTWPRWRVVAAIDLMLSVAIIGAAAAGALYAYADAIFKAKLSEAMWAVSNSRGEIIERLALTGDPVETQIEGSVVSLAGAEAYLSGRRTISEAKQSGTSAKSAAKPEPIGFGLASAQRRLENNELAAEGGGQSSRYVSSVRVSGNSIIAAGTIDGRAYELALYPAVADEEVPVVYIWLCGRARIPEGWLTQPPALSRNLPHNLQPSECRRRRSE